MRLLRISLFGLRYVLLSAALTQALLPLLAAQERPTVRYRLPTFHVLTRNSGYIFGGTVKSVSKIRGNAESVETVQITFHVENAIRGVRRGQTLSIREWAGLWESGVRYRIGEHVVLFLFKPGKLGLTSPVGGTLGKFTVDPYGRILLNRNQVAAISADPILAGAWQGKSRMRWQEFSGGVRRTLEN